MLLLGRRRFDVFNYLILLHQIFVKFYSICMFGQSSLHDDYLMLNSLVCDHKSLIKKKKKSRTDDTSFIDSCFVILLLSVSPLFNILVLHYYQKQILLCLLQYLL